MDIECNDQEPFNETFNVTCTTNTWDHRPLIALNFNLAVGYITIVLLMGVLGLTGGSFVIYWITREKKMSFSCKCFLFNSAMADLCVSGMAIPICIAGAFLGSQYFDGSFWLCSLVASICLTACICAFLNFTCLTINRWIFICHRQQFSRIYTKSRIISLCLFCWVCAILAELPNFFGWGAHVFDRKTHQCIWDRTASRSYTLFISLGVLSSPFIINGVCHIAIFRKLWNVKRAMSTYHKNDQNHFMQSIQSAKTLIGMYLVFFVCWLPYILVLVIDHDDTFSTEAHLFVTLLAHAHSSAAFFIYLAFNRNLRDLVQKIRGRRRRPNRVNPIQTLPCSRLSLHQERIESRGVGGIHSPLRTGMDFNVSHKQPSSNLNNFRGMTSLTASYAQELVTIKGMSARETSFQNL